MPERHMPKLTTASLRTSTKAAFLVAVTVLAYLPTLRNGFIWDDDAWLMHNRTLEGVNGLYRLWSYLLALQQYYPITGTGFLIQYQLWGFHPVRLSCRECRVAHTKRSSVLVRPAKARPARRLVRRR